MTAHPHTLDAILHKEFLAEGRRDPYTQEPLNEGDVVAFCARCKSAFLLASWEAIGGQHCGQPETLGDFPGSFEVQRLGRVPPATSFSENSNLGRGLLALVLVVVILSVGVYFSTIQQAGVGPDVDSASRPTLVVAPGSMGSTPTPPTPIPVEDSPPEESEKMDVKPRSDHVIVDGPGENPLEKLLRDLEEAIVRRDTSAQRSVAHKILEIDRNNPEARVVREHELHETIRKSQQLAQQEDGAGVEAVWSEFKKNWPGFAAGEDEEARAVELVEELRSARLASETLSQVTFVRIAGRTFDMGCSASDPDCQKSELPVKKAFVSTFMLSETETTNRLYQKCVEAGECQAPSNVEAFYEESKADNPVAWVTWLDAQTFCAWVGGRLPSEAEWELAARGLLVGARYPWGNQISHEDANFLGRRGRDVWEGTSPVGSFSPNRHGLYDMAGNVREWVGENYSEYKSDHGGSRNNLKIIRGGAWDQKEEDLRVSARQWAGPSGRNENLGFRCAKDLE